MSAANARGMLVEPAAQCQRCGPDGLAHHGRVDDLQPEIGQPNRPLCVLRLRRSGGGGGLSALQSREATGEERVREGFRPCCEHVGLRRRISCWAHGGRLCLREQQPHRVHVARGERFLHWDGSAVVDADYRRRSHHDANLRWGVQRA